MLLKTIQVSFFEPKKVETMCCEDHDVIISNLNDNDLISYEILLVKGTVSKTCEAQKIFVRNIKTQWSSEFDISQRNGRFKVLCQLNDGQNAFELRYCNKTVIYNWTYRKPNREYCIQPIYIICDGHDGRFMSDSANNDAEEACRKITLGLKLVQTLYAEKLLEQQLERKTFSIKSDCLIFHSKLSVEKAWELDEASLWNSFAKELINSDLGEDEKLKFAAFIGCTKYEGVADGDFSYANIKKHTKAQANLGGGGLALFGTGCLYTWPSNFEEIVPSFKKQTKIDLSRQLDDSNYRQTYSGCFSTTLGAVCHEIGHTFDLGHTPDGIMGNGFDYIHLVFTVNELTENLPNRIVRSASNSKIKDSRLTSLRNPGEDYLQRHHEQKLNDSTFFSRSCALILHFHRWFNSDCPTGDDEIIFDAVSLQLTVKTSIKVIEFREKINGLVTKHLEFLSPQSPVRSLVLLGKLNTRTHNLFVITSNGTTKLFTNDEP